MENYSSERYTSFSDIKKNKCKIPQCLVDLFNLIVPITIVFGTILFGIWICTFI